MFFFVIHPHAACCMCVCMYFDECMYVRECMYAACCVCVCTSMNICMYVDGAAVVRSWYVLCLMVQYGMWQHRIALSLDTKLCSCRYRHPCVCMIYTLL